MAKDKSYSGYNLSRRKTSMLTIDRRMKLQIIAAKLRI